VQNLKSVLIIGGSGFIGTHLALALREEHKVIATYHSKPMSIPGVTFLPLNVDNRSWIKRVIYSIRPNAVIYAAGNNSWAWSDKNSRRAELLHSVGPATVSNATDILQPKFIYLSNAYVFDGNRGNYHENDTILPAALLGKMKVSGENVVKSKSLNYIIVRSSPVFGRGNGVNLSALDYVRMRLDRKSKVEVSTQEVHSFAPVEGLCDLIKRLIDSGIRNRVLHYGGLTKLTFYELSQAFAKRFNYDPGLILPKAKVFKKGSSEFPTYDFSLNSTQAVDTLKIKPFLLEEGFDLIEKQLIPNF
jgi:dTDP-4-dehydrorhamnose reductase